MDVVGVIDLRHGRAVHARGGVREAYAPVHVPGDDGAGAGDAAALAAYYARLGVRALYVADLDAIEGRSPQRGAVEALVSPDGAAPLPVWLDAACRAPADVTCVSGIARLVIGLETLPSLDALAPLVAAAGATPLVLSLDLRHGVAITSGAERDPLAIAHAAAGAGVGTILLLDLGRVGAGTGFDTVLLARLRAALPSTVSLAVGGGLAHRRDLEAASDAGCAAVLVASALLDGRLTAADVHAVRSRR